MLNLVTVKLSPSTSVSLVKTLPVAVVPAGVSTISVAGNGESLALITESVNVPMVFPPFPSLMV
jgi:hypothetical protein